MTNDDARMTIPDKPQKQTVEFYDYRQCRDYLQNKYGYNERDYAGRFVGSVQDDGRFVGFARDVPYRDFWHWVIENHDVHNGGYIMFSREALDDIEEEWVREIYSHYLDEFADKFGELTLRTRW